MLRATKTFRWTSPLRRLYGHVVTELNEYQKIGLHR
jgi:hypothetical protein